MLYPLSYGGVTMPSVSLPRWPTLKTWESRRLIWVTAESTKEIVRTDREPKNTSAAPTMTVVVQPGVDVAVKRRKMTTTKVKLAATMPANAVKYAARTAILIE